MREPPPDLGLPGRVPVMDTAYAYRDMPVVLNIHT
jgi:hypothetical protein